MNQKRALRIFFLFVLMVTICFQAESQAKSIKKPKLNKTKLSLTVGKTTTLKVKNTKKKVSWSSSKKSVATVSKKGKVTAKKKGTATITAKVGKTKLKCKITVTKAKKKTSSGSVSNTGTNTGNTGGNNTGSTNNNAGTNSPTTKPGIKIVSASVLNTHSVVVTLSEKQELHVDNFKLMCKETAKGNYNCELEVSRISTDDQKCYILDMDSDRIHDNNFVQVTITGLKGTGTASFETVFISSDQNQDDCLSYSFCRTIGEEINEVIPMLGQGYNKITAIQLPPGLRYETNHSVSWGDNIYITGAPTEAGIFHYTIEYCGEEGEIFSVDTLWVIGSEASIQAGCLPSYEIIEENQNCSLSCDFLVAGGSGNYTYKVLGDSNAEILPDRKNIQAEFTSAGKYETTIEVTDANNPELKTTFIWTVNLVEGKKVMISFFDADGSPISSLGSYIYITPQDKTNPYPIEHYTLTDEEGNSYTILPDGTYDILTRFKAKAKSILGYPISGNNPTIQIRFPFHKITLSTDNTDINLDDVYWYDEEENQVGTGSTLYLDQGKYKLFGETKTGTVTHSLKTEFTVAEAPLEATVQVTSKDYLVGPLTLNTPVKADLDSQNYSYFSFVPEETGTYKFYSTGPWNTTVMFCDSNVEQIFCMDGGGDGDNFSFTYECEAGKTYYVAASLLEPDGESKTVTLVSEKVS
ncbi:MAG: Ig-like domain-containing protein [Eubacterium sp.]|nr:Ig-like domain-containing protein [Eubacterium sp.]